EIKPPVERSATGGEQPAARWTTGALPRIALRSIRGFIPSPASRARRQAGSGNVMNLRAFTTGLMVFFAPAFARAQADELTIDREPVLRVTAGGPTAFVTSLAFGAGGQALYAGGYDKVLHLWTANPQQVFTSSPSPFRLPVGPGIDGAINNLAISSDGTWLA